MGPGERTNRDKKPARSPSPPVPRPSKVTKRPSTHGSSKLRNHVLQSEPNLDGKVALLNLLQEDTAREQTNPNVSRPSGLRLKLALPREQIVEEDAALSTAPRTGHTLKVSGSGDDEAIYEAALILFNMKTIRPQLQRQSTLNTSAVDRIADISSANRSGVLGNEIKQYEEHNRMVNAAQTLMSISHIEPPHGPGAWRKTKFRLLPHENEGADASNRGTVIHDDGLGISDHTPEDCDKYIQG